jgi:hypothetical protein
MFSDLTPIGTTHKWEVITAIKARETPLLITREALITITTTTLLQKQLHSLLITLSMGHNSSSKSNKF